MLFCPWCLIWNPVENYSSLQTPPNFEDQCPPVVKHSKSLGGCGGLFSVYVESEVVDEPR